MIDLEDPNEIRRIRITVLAIIANVFCVSLLQALFFATLNSGDRYNIAAIILSAFTLFLAGNYLRKGGINNLWPLLILYLLNFLFFVWKFHAVSLPFHPRLLLVSLIAMHCSMILTIILAIIGISQPRAILSSLLLATILILLEAIFTLLPNAASKSDAEPEWSGAMQPHVLLGAVYRPGSVLKTYHPANPENYFFREDDRKEKFWLRVEKGNEAQLRFPSADAEAVRVEIEKITGQRDWDIQLNLSHFSVSAQKEYFVRFRARAASPRNLFAGFSMSHEPWEGLGLYTEIHVTEEWQQYRLRFKSTESDQNARIHFDLGQSREPVEITSITLLSADGKIVDPTFPRQKYYMSYHFNAFGCRDRDFSLEPQANVERILFLGDSYTLGVGVQESDTMPKQLERMLNGEKKQGEKRFEVMNCGITGLDTERKRLFYQIHGKKFKPKTVFLVMSLNDGKTVVDPSLDKRRKPGPLDALFFSWARIQEYRHQPPLLNFSNCSQEILKLHEKLRSENSNLVIVIFRNDDDFSGRAENGRNWNQLSKAIAEGIDGSEIPIIDLGKVLADLPQDSGQERLFFNHPDPADHAKAAKEIYRFLRS